MELDDSIYREIAALSQEGNASMDDAQYPEAIATFEKALALVPSPKSEWEAATWLYASLGDAFYMLQDYAGASDHFFDALNCPAGLGNPFIHLRLGECLYRMGNHAGAEEHLMRAFMLEGEGIFENEPAEYLEFLRERALLEGGSQGRPLDEDLTKEIFAKWDEACEFEEKGSIKQAEKLYLTTWSMLPAPRESWDFSWSVAYSIAEFYRDSAQLEEAEKWIKLLFQCHVPPIDTSSYVLAGQVYYDSDQKDEAYKYLAEAHKRGKRRAFAEEDPKYLDFVLERLGD